VGAIEKQASLHTVYRMITKHGPPAAFKIVPKSCTWS